MSAGRYSPSFVFVFVNQVSAFVALLLTVLFVFQPIKQAFANNGLTGVPVSTVLQRVQGLDDAADYDVIIDTRPLASCLQSSLAGAACVPVEDLLAPNRRLANWPGILWLLGTANLSGDEHVLVTGQHHDRRHFIAGLLLLSGQRFVTIVDTPLSELIRSANGSDKFPGTRRSTTRTRVYTSPMRSSLIVLQSDLTNTKTVFNSDTDTVLLDGRTESEYYGVTIRSVRGGHLPGAIHSPVSLWQQSPQTMMATLGSVGVVAYAHDVYESVGYLALMHASGVQARVYPAGWAEWAVNAELPADSVSYADITTARESARADKHHSGISTEAGRLTISRAGVTVAATCVAGLLLVSFFAGRKFTTKFTTVSS